MEEEKPQVAPVQEGDIIANKYRVEHVLGQGGMGVVVAARHTELGERVALKFLLAGAMQRPQVVERFLREARAAVKIKSEHVARVSDVGRLPTGAPYMVMEFLEGQDLGQVLEERKVLPVAEAVGYVLQACEALAEAHSLGIVHRDIKPSNLFLTRRHNGGSLVKVLDFGIAKATFDDAAEFQGSLTQTAQFFGSPLYMSPEQIRSAKNADARSDIWSLGVLLYQLVTGQLPFDGESVHSLFAAIIADVPRSPASRGIELPAGLDAVLLRCLAKSPAERFVDVADFAEALSPYATSLARVSLTRMPRSRAPVGTGSTFEPLSSPGVASQTNPTSDEPLAISRPTGPGPRWPLLAGLAAALLAGGSLLLRSPATTPAATPPLSSLSNGATGSETAPLPLVVPVSDPVAASVAAASSSAPAASSALARPAPVDPNARPGRPGVDPAPGKKPPATSPSSSPPPGVIDGTTDTRR